MTSKDETASGLPEEVSFNIMDKYFHEVSKIFSQTILCNGMHVTSFQTPQLVIMTWWPWYIHSIPSDPPCLDQCFLHETCSSIT